MKEINRKITFIPSKFNMSFQKLSIGTWFHWFYIEILIQVVGTLAIWASHGKKQTYSSEHGSPPNLSVNGYYKYLHEIF